MDGIIYALTSPSGKIYIGQTIRKFKKRFREHVRNAENGACTILSTAIRKYGADSFQKEILCYSDPTELNDWEKLYINFLNTLHPDGYNLQPGGQTGGGVIYDDVLRQKISDAHRKYFLEDFELPIYFRYVNKDGQHGFRINIPNKKAYTFYDSNMTLAQKYDLAIEKYQQVMAGTDDPTENRRKKSEFSKNLPLYVSYTENRDVFEVRIPGFPRKSFRSVSLSTEEKYNQAMEYYNSILATQFND